MKGSDSQSLEDDFALSPLGIFGNVQRHFWWSECFWHHVLRARDAANNIAMHKTPPVNTDYLVWNINTENVKKKTLFTECIFTQHSILFSWILPQIPHGEFPLLWIILSIIKSNVVQHIELWSNAILSLKNKMLKIFLEEWEKTKDCLYLL